MDQGFVSPDGIAFCAEMLDLTKAEVGAVATFYTMYKRKPTGDYHVGVCTNTLCAVMGGDAIPAELQEHLGVGNDETTADGKIDARARRVQRGLRLRAGVTVNWEFFDNQTPESAKHLISKMVAGWTFWRSVAASACNWW